MFVLVYVSDTRHVSCILNQFTLVLLSMMDKSRDESKRVLSAIEPLSR